MDLAGMGVALLRRWVVVLVGLVLAVVAGVGAYASAGLSWSSEAVVVVVPPSGVAGGASNPYLQLDYTVATTASILVQSISSAPVAADIARSTSGSYTASNVQLDPQTSTPSITVTSTSGSPADAVATAQAVVSRLGDKLTELQVDSAVAGGDRLTITTAVAPTEAVSAASGRIRSAGAALVAVALLTLVAALALDGYLRSPRRTTARSTKFDDGPVTSEPPAETAPTSSGAAARTATASVAVGKKRPGAVAGSARTRRD